MFAFPGIQLCASDFLNVSQTRQTLDVHSVYLLFSLLLKVHLLYCHTWRCPPPPFTPSPVTLPFEGWCVNHIPPLKTKAINMLVFTLTAVTTAPADCVAVCHELESGLVLYIIQQFWAHDGWVTRRRWHLPCWISSRRWHLPTPKMYRSTTAREILEHKEGWMRKGKHLHMFKLLCSGYKR